MAYPVSVTAFVSILALESACRVSRSVTSLLISSSVSA
jgi:hypothetical protein